MNAIGKTKASRSLNGNQQLMAYVFISVPFLLFAVFMVIPVIWGFYLSFTNYDIIQKAKFLGFQNYIDIFKDPFFITSIENTFYYAVIVVVFTVIVSLATALLLNQKFGGVKIFRICFYLPVLSSSIATATIWSWLLNPQYGMINMMLSWIGINGPVWLANSSWAMLSIIMMCTWQGFGVYMMIYLAGLQGIPDYLYESGKLDGANVFQLFRYITFPALRNITFLVTTLLCISAFQMFDQAYLLTQGGPGNSTLTMVYYIYNTGFGSLRMGYSSALSFVVFLIILIFSLVNMRLNRNTIEY